MKNMGCEVSIQVHPMPTSETDELLEPEVKPLEVKPVKSTKVYPELKRQLSSESCITVVLEDDYKCDESDFV